MNIYYRIDVAVDIVKLPNGTSYHRSQLQGIMGDILNSIADFAIDLQRSEIDLPSQCTEWYVFYHIL